MGVCCNVGSDGHRVGVLSLEKGTDCSPTHMELCMVVVNLNG